MEDLLKRSEGLREKAEGLPEGSKSLSEGLLGRTYRYICKGIFHILKDFVPYSGRYPKTDSVLEIFSLLFVALMQTQSVLKSSICKVFPCMDAPQQTINNTHHDKL